MVKVINLIPTDPEDGPYECHETISELLDAHPEIEEACLIWTWNHSSYVEDDDGATFYYLGRTVDWEYSFAGRRWSLDDEPKDELREWADSYGCWDNAKVSIEGHSLIGQVDAWDPNTDDDPDRGYPDGEETYNIGLTTIVLPSGKEVEL